MAFGRVDAASYLGGVLAQWLTDAGMTAADTAGNLKEPIDDAFLAVGVAWDDLATAEVAAAGVPGLRKVLRWQGLARVLDAIGGRVDVDIAGDGGKKRSQAVVALSKRVEEARAAAAPYVTAPAGWRAGAVGLGWVEPEYAAE